MNDGFDYSGAEAEEFLDLPNRPTKMLVALMHEATLGLRRMGEFDTPTSQRGRDYHSLVSALEYHLNMRDPREQDPSPC